MGLTLEFLTGNPGAIQAAVAAAEFELLDEPGVIEHRADFSLHLFPRDLDTMSQCLGRRNGHTPVDLRSHLSMLVDTADGGAFLVDPAWVSYVAAVPLDSISEVVADWFSCMASEYPAGDPGAPVVNDAADDAVKQLWHLCAAAHRTAAPVIHVWYP